MLCMGFASIIGGATGFGTALIATPLMLLAGVDVIEIVVVNLIVGLVTRIAVSVQLREQIDWGRVALLGCASLPGAWLGVLTVNMLPGQYLKPAAAVLTVLCGLAMVLPSSPNPKPPSRATNIAVGMVGGYFSTTTSLNGPPVVLLLSGRNCRR
ncbi:sulfite exporter TauE/SafE family protein [Rhodococcus sp. IEGM 1379]|uniref:sulfite exporter TauE/SafE family protein n=1 Tax=Rhodococcus sp. IEGM 1379 TaxID=3047086 RepID=UPI0032D580CD